MGAEVIEKVNNPLIFNGDIPGVKSPPIGGTLVTMPRRSDLAPRFGIGEWFGFDLSQISATERRHLAAAALAHPARGSMPCPFQALKPDAACTKAGGVCSLRLYAAEEQHGRRVAVPVAGPPGYLRSTCPYRFHEQRLVFRWVGEHILGDPDPLLVTEVPFLEAPPSSDNEGGDDVGRIDMVLVRQTTQPSMDWVALEIQAVYFSGDAMRQEFVALSRPDVDWLVFPSGRRRPDYRSSGPKRLMPQLQIKVPALRRWGKKMAVVVDRSFFDSIGDMDDVSDISNADIAWFIVRFESAAGNRQATMVLDEVRYTTLERSVEGLTGGRPVPKPVFEQRISDKLRSRLAAAVNDHGS